MSSPSVIFLMADYGHDPTETAIPWSKFHDAGFTIAFATENGVKPTCDSRMLTGWTQKVLGATRKAIDAYERMQASPEIQQPLVWSSPGFTIQDYDVVFLPGGHEKGVRQQIESKVLQKQLGEYWTKAVKPSKKHVGAICHGVLALSEAEYEVEGKQRSVLWEAKSTALPSFMENAAYQGTRLILGDYYKTFGKGSDNVETVVRSRMKDPAKQWASAMSGSAFIVSDDKYNYFSGRFPPDAELLAQTIIDSVKSQDSKL